MASNVQVLYNESTTGTTATTTAWVDLATIDAASFTAGRTYLIIANQLSIHDNSTNYTRARLVYGTTPTAFTDASLQYEGTATTQEHEVSWMYTYTQPSTPDLVKIQISNNTTGSTITNRLSQIIAIDITEFESGTNYYWTEDTVDYTYTTTPTAKATSSSFTPNGSDVWLYAANLIHAVNTTLTTQISFELYDSVAGVLNRTSQEGEDTNDQLGANQYWVGVPTNSARTIAVRPSQATTADATMLSARTLAINLTKLFTQVSYVFAAGEVDPATQPTYTNVATVSPTPAVTGNWVYLAFSNQDVNETTTDWEARLQVNPDGGGLVSDPAFASTAPSIDQWDPTDETAFSVFKLRQLNSGAARAINWDWRQVAGTTGRVEDNGLVAFSVVSKKFNHEFGQSQATIKIADIEGFGQAQAEIVYTRLSYAQAQTQIISITTYAVHSQVNIWIVRTENAWAQVQAEIKQTYQTYSQAQSGIKQQYQSYAQSSATLKQTYNSFAQVNTWIKSIYNDFSQAQSSIKATTSVWAQTEARILGIVPVFAQAQAEILSSLQTYNGLAQAQTAISVGTNIYQYIDESTPVDTDYILTDYNPNLVTYIAALENINEPEYRQDHIVRYRAYKIGPNSGSITVELLRAGNLIATRTQGLTDTPTTYEYALTQPEIDSIPDYADLQLLFNTSSGVDTRSYVTFAEFQAPAGNAKIRRGFAQAGAFIQLGVSRWTWAQAQGSIKQTYTAYVQAQADIRTTYWALAQVNTWIKITINAWAQSQANIKQIYQTYSQAQTDIKAVYVASGQAQGILQQATQVFAQAQATIKSTTVSVAQVQANIKTTYQVFAQAQTLVTTYATKYAQANAYIKIETIEQVAQAQSTIKTNYAQFAQTLAQIKQTYIKSANAQGIITTSVINNAQVQALIKQTYQIFAQTQALILTSGIVVAQATVWIKASAIQVSQAEAIIIKAAAYAQTQAYIEIVNFLKKLELADRILISLVLSDRVTISTTLTDSCITMTMGDSGITLTLNDHSNQTLELSDKNY